MNLLRAWAMLLLALLIGHGFLNSLTSWQYTEVEACQEMLQINP